MISIHVPLTGSDEAAEQLYKTSQIISIHVPLAGSDTNAIRDIEFDGISIHAPLAGSDQAPVWLTARKVISIHAPLAGSDPSSHPILILSKKFQSTSPSRGATLSIVKSVNMAGCFNPRPPRGERHIRGCRRSMKN